MISRRLSPWDHRADVCQGMNDRAWHWWVTVALLIAAGEVVLSVGNLISLRTDDQASVGSALISAAGGLVLATLVVGGIVLRRSGRPWASVGVAAGVLPGCAGLMFWWFAPAVLVGLLSAVVVGFALADAARDRRMAVSGPTSS